MDEADEKCKPKPNKLESCLSTTTCDDHKLQNEVDRKLCIDRHDLKE